MNNNRIALVTGGARGIGKAICRTLANDGFKIAVNYNNSEAEALALKEELSAVTEVEIFKCDVSDSISVKEMFSEISQKLGNVNVLVNNAGVAEQVLFTDITDEMWQRMINTNLSSIIVQKGFNYLQELTLTPADGVICYYKCTAVKRN